MARKKNPFADKILDEICKGYKEPKDFWGEDGILKQLTKAVLERCLEGELTTELGYEKHDPQGKNSGNSRNGYSEKTVTTKEGVVPIDVPRDRNGEFEPQILPKHQTRFDGFDDKIISLYARGMSTRDIQEQLKDLYGVEVSPTLISNVTAEVIEEVKLWQTRPLDKIYPILYLDALVIRVKEDNRVKNKAFYLALGINIEGKKELLGIWVSENEGAKFWLGILTDLKNRGIEEVLVSCVDGLTGFPEAIQAVYPKAQVQLCIVHMIRNSLRFVGWNVRKAVANDLKTIYSAATLPEAEMALEAFSKKWDSQFPMISKTWRAHWAGIIPFFEYPPEIRKVIYTTNAIESLNMSLRKVIKNKRIFPSDEAAFKQLFLAIKNISKKWTMPIRNWRGALNYFIVMFEERVTQYL